MNEHSTFKEQNDTNPLVQYAQKFLPYWPLFVLTIVMSLAIAYVYLRAQPIVYQAYGKILIKDPVKNGSDSKVLDEFNITGEKKSLENEILILRSITLMKEVVRKLNLSVSVFNEGRVRTEELYKDQSPVSFRPVDSTKPVTDAGQYYFSVDWHTGSVEIDGKKIPFNGKLTLANTVYQVVPNLDYNKNLSGKKYYAVFNSNEAAAGDLVGNLNANTISASSSVLDIKLNTTVPAKGIDVLNSLFDVYNEYTIHDKNKIARKTIDFIEERLRLVSRQLDSAEKGVATFKSSNNAVDITGMSQNYLAQTFALDQQNSQIDLQLEVLQGVKKYVSSKGGDQGVVPSMTGLTDNTLNTLMSSLYSAQTELEKSKAVNGEQSDAVVQAAQQVTKLKADIQDNISNVERNLLTTKGSYSRLIGKNSSMLSGVPQKERELVDITRNREIKNSIYVFLLQKREDAALNSASTIEDLNVLESAIAYGPISPIPKSFYTTGLMFGILIPLGFVLLKDLLNRRVMFRSEIEQKTTIPIVAEISYVNTNNSAVVISEGKRTVIAEQFRSLRTNLTFMGLTEKCNTILVTSSVSGEGKSFTAINLAVSFSLMGKKVVLMEMDLRKPKISKLLGLRNDVGISNYLVNQCALEDIINATDVKDLSILSSGIIPPNPTELIQKEKFADMMAQLKKRFDFIIIDTAPVGPVSDAFLLKQYADATIFMVRHNGTLRVHLKMIEDLKQQKRFNNICIVFNGLKKRGFTYGSYGYGSYEDTYGGGYYVNDEPLGKIKTFGKRIQKTFGMKS